MPPALKPFPPCPVPPPVPLACSDALTENTRASYPIEFIANAVVPCQGPHPKNVVLLCCDAFGVIPPVSRLTQEQAMYHFISGYTAKVGGCWVCHVLQPRHATPWHPSRLHFRDSRPTPHHTQHAHTHTSKGLAVFPCPHPRVLVSVFLTMGGVGFIPICLLVVMLTTPPPPPLPPLQIAGTEQGVLEPQATFSACYGAAFLMWHPMKYAAMLAEKMTAHGTTAWLLNTGWSGGK